MKLKLFMRKLQMYDEFQNPVWYTGSNPNSLGIVQGYLPDNEYKEYTQYIDNLHELASTWKVRNSETVGGSNKTISNIEKSVTNELQFFGDAYQYIKSWVFDHVAAPLNAIEVKIEIENCGNIIDYIIKREGITYCDDARCNYDVNLKQRDDYFTCIYSTLITDNHMNMFDGNYQHPRFSYCNEFRPTILLSMLFQVLGMVFFVLFILLTVFWFIQEVIEVILDIVVFITTLGFGSDPELDLIPDPEEMKDKMLDVFVDLFGCGREHPAPLVRDYIRNVCSNCNIQISAESIPFFFNPSSKYYNTTYLSAEVKKGVHRDSNEYWISDNDPILTLDMLLDKLRKVFNAKWYIKGGTLYFLHVDEIENDFIFDFIGDDKNLILDNVCYSWNEINKPAFMRVGYTVDPFDNLTSDCLRRYNDIVEFNKPINPILKGEDNRTLIDFAPTRFRNDGIDRDYVCQTLDPLNDSTASGILGILLSSSDIGFAVVRAEVKNRMEGFDRAILMQNNTTMMPRLIIWDGVSKKAARAVSEYRYGHTLPSPNYKYNPDGIPYDHENGEDEHYDEYYDRHNWLVNYPMVFDAKYKNNLWDFHETEDPRFNPPINNEFELSIPLCCDTLNRLNIFNDSGNINLERKVKVNGGAFYQEGIIKEISLHFSSKNKLGQHIKIKGII